MNISLSKNDEIVMKLIHYFITEKGYNPIVLHGAKDEIWLENSEEDYQIIRIVTNYIHNDEQFDFDIYRTQQIMRRIQKKTLTLKMNALSIFINLGDNVHLEDSEIENIDCIEIKDLDDLEEYEFVLEEFPDITRIDEVPEKGLELFMKLTEDINHKNIEDAKQAEEVFSKKRPIITYALLISNFIVFLCMVLAGANPFDVSPTIAFNFGGLVNYETMNGISEMYRIITAMFVHGDVLHILFNMYSLYILGPQLESFFGKTKFLIIYFGSGIIGNLMCMLFLDSYTVAMGASGAIFGLFGALIYFGYHYRVYLGNVLRSQLIPLLIFNLIISVMAPQISLSAHVGGLIGGYLVTKMVGVKYKSTKVDMLNGFIMTSILVGFLSYMIFS